MAEYLTTIARVRVRYEMVDSQRGAFYNHLISNKYEWNNCFIKNAHKISRILPDFICKNNRFSACFLFWTDAHSYHIWRAWYNGSYAMMAKPIGALELYYPMIQFLINVIYFWRVLLSWNDVKRWRKNSTWLQSMVSDVYHLLTHLACVAGAWK